MQAVLSSQFGSITTGSITVRYVCLPSRQFPSLTFDTDREQDVLLEDFRKPTNERPPDRTPAVAVHSEEDTGPA